MIDHKKRDDVMQELLVKEGPRLSVYLPTHLSFPENRQDPIQYKNLLKELEAELETQLPRRDWQETMEKLNLLLDDQQFWNHTSLGLGVLAVDGRVETFLLDTPAGLRRQWGKHFHLLPLYPLLDSISHAFLADISRDRFTLHEVSQDGIRAVELPEVKQSFPELFDDFDPNSTLRTGSYSGLSGAFHGHGGKADVLGKEREKYFRYLDEAFASVYKDQGFPVMLAGTEASISAFRKLAKGSFYLEGAITQPLDSMDLRDVLAQAKGILRPHLEKQLESLRTQISNKRNEKKVAAEMPAIQSAAREGRVDTLLVPITSKESEWALVDEAVEQVILNGGTVLSAEHDILDTLGGRVALLRY